MFFPPSYHHPLFLSLPFSSSLLIPSQFISLYVIHLAPDVPAWLKSLRLHKYAALFSQMTYEEMMALTECQLEAQVRVSLVHSLRSYSSWNLKFKFKILFGLVYLYVSSLHCSRNCNWSQLVHSKLG